MIHTLTYSYPETEYEEIFKKIIYPGIKDNMYLISNYGRVFNIKKKIIMKSYYDKDDHEKITLVTNIKHPTRRGNKSKHYFIHRLMLWTFIGPPPDEDHTICNHINNIPCCNFIHNLEWCSILENTNKAKEIGAMDNTGINSYNCKYPEKLIRKICKCREKGYSIVEIVELVLNLKKYKDYNKNSIVCLVKRICYKTSFHDIVSQYEFDIPDNIKKCSPEIQLIRDMILDGKNNFEILKEFGYETVSDNKTFYNGIIY